MLLYFRPRLSDCWNGGEFIENFFTARYTLQEVDEALSHNLTQLILKGPAEELNLTKNTQPALLAISLAILRTLEKNLTKKQPILVLHGRPFSGRIQRSFVQQGF